MRRSIRKRHLIWILAAMGIAAAACAVNPVTGKKQLSLMSEEDEIAIGSKSDPQIVAEFGLYDDPKVAAYVDRVGQKMAGLSHRPSLKWTFRSWTRRSSTRSRFPAAIAISPAASWRT